MAAKNDPDKFNKIMSDLKAGIYKPIYLLMGEEPYFIDVISEYIKANALKDEEKDFNLTQVYGSDTNMIDVIANARRYPMMAERSVVIVKEAQNISDFDAISSYVQKPQMQTVLVLCYKHKKVDSKKKYVSEIAKIGEVFDAKPLYENQVPPYITSYLNEKNRKISSEIAMTLVNALGTNLTKIINELDKLCTVVGEGQAITAEIIEKYIGISKDYNSFELQKAIIAKDILKANQIILYAEKNPKNIPLQPLLSMLFNFFSNLIIYFYMKGDKSNRDAVAKELGVAPFQAINCMQAASKYNAVKTMNIITQIRKCDARSKGVGGATIPDAELMKELIHFIIY